MLISDKIALCGVIVSGSFSLLLLIATWKSSNAAKQSAIAAKSAADLAANFEKERKLKASAMREQLKISLQKQALQAFQILEHISKLDSAKLENPESRRLRIEPAYLAEYFSENERKTINDIWHELDMYFFNYWKPNLQNGNIIKKARHDDQEFLRIQESLKERFAKLHTESFLTS